MDNLGIIRPEHYMNVLSRQRLNGYGTDLNSSTLRNMAVGLIWPK
jgi:hypothetical protein